MPPRTALSTPLRAWRCPGCTLRSFSASADTRNIGPEHPRYIPIREPPQQGNPPPKFIKGRLPVPRDVFKGPKAATKGSDEWIDSASKLPTRATTYEPRPNSREQWKAEVSAMRRQNLREGIKSLHARKTRVEAHLAQKQARNRLEREKILYKPEREEDRLTTPSHGLDLENLLRGGKLPDPTREARLEHKRQNYAAHVARKQEERFGHVNTLYAHAQEFIVTQEQLEKAVDVVFGSEDVFEEDQNAYRMPSDRPPLNIWEKGPPDSLATMLENSAYRPGRTATSSLDRSPLAAEVTKRRMKRIAEVLTGGKIGEADDVDALYSKGW